MCLIEKKHRKQERNREKIRELKLETRQHAKTEKSAEHSKQPNSIVYCVNIIFKNDIISIIINIIK